MSAASDPIVVPAEGIAETKAHLRLEGDAEDALISRLIGAAIGVCEGFTGTQLLIREVRETIPAAGEWRRLGTTPVRAIVDVSRLAADGGSALLAADVFAPEIDAGGDGWVRVTQAGGRVSVRYQAGLAAEWGDLPEAVRHGIIRLAAHLYTHRDAADDGGPPAAVTALWRPWRRMRLR